MIASYLGETAVRFSRLFDQVRTRRCVLFFDEFDVVGKERGDLHETGEIKRVVSSLLLRLPESDVRAIVAERLHQWRKHVPPTANRPTAQADEGDA